jgi:hypothetical protein
MFIKVSQWQVVRMTQYGSIVETQKYNINGEYEVIKKTPKKVHLYCSDRGIDLYLTPEKFKKAECGENIEVNFYGE